MSKPLLSVVIASFSDPDIVNTVASIHATTGAALMQCELEVLVIDDASSSPVRLSFAQCLNVKVVRNSQRIGCGPSRYVGAMAATGDWLLFVDAHSRFPSGWFDTWRAGCGMATKTLYCGRCFGLPEDGDVNKPKGEYSGATWNFAGPDRNTGKGHQVFECVWAPEKPDRTYETAACMGACYFIHRETFIELNLLRHLRLWGGDEQELSLKVWMSGGSIVLLKNVRIGHKFRTGKITGSFVMPWHVLYNKMFVAETCLPEEYIRRLRPKFQRESQYNMANRALRLDWHLVETMRAYNAKIFERSFQSYLERFSLSFP